MLGGTVFGGRDKIGDLRESFVGRGVNVGEGVSSFVAYGRKAELADAKSVIKDGSLLEADIFDIFETYDIERLRK